MRYVVGIDAGGTKTVGLLADESGQVLAEARGSGANLQTSGELEVEKVFDGVLETLGREHPIAAVCLGISLSTANRGWKYARAWLYAAMTALDSGKSAPT